MDRNDGFQGERPVWGHKFVRLGFCNYGSDTSVECRSGPAATLQPVSSSPLVATRNGAAVDLDEPLPLVTQIFVCKALLSADGSKHTSAVGEYEASYILACPHRPVHGQGCVNVSDMFITLAVEQLFLRKSKYHAHTVRSFTFARGTMAEPSGNDLSTR